MPAISLIPKISFYLDVPNISQLNSLPSPEVIVHEISWKVLIEKTTQHKENYIGISLSCRKFSDSIHWSHAAKATFRLHPFDEDLNELKMQLAPYLFNNWNNVQCSETFIKLSDLFDEKNKYVKDGAIKLEIIIEFPVPNEMNKSQMILKNIDKCCGRSSHTKFQLTVGNIDKLMADRTDSFRFCSFPYSFMVSKYHGQLYITLEPGESLLKTCETTMALELISSNGNSIEKIQTKRVKNRKNLICEKIVSWDELFKIENGFVENNTITIDIELLSGKKGDIFKKRKMTSPHVETKYRAMECAVCLLIINNQETSFTPCGHLFCTTCITKSIEERESCPLCSTRTTINDVKRAFLP